MNAQESGIKKLVDEIFNDNYFGCNIDDESLHYLKGRLTTTFEAVEHSLRHQLHVTARGNWIPVSKELPPMELPVWLSEAGNIFIGCRVMEDDQWFWADCNTSQFFNKDYQKWEAHDAFMDNDYQPTHWLLLPEPPLS